MKRKPASLVPLTRQTPLALGFNLGFADREILNFPNWLHIQSQKVVSCRQHLNRRLIQIMAMYAAERMYGGGMWGGRRSNFACPSSVFELFARLSVILRELFYEHMGNDGAPHAESPNAE